MQKISLFLLAQYLCSTTLFAQNIGDAPATTPTNPPPKSLTETNAPTVTPLPDLMILPWQNLSLDPDTVRTTKDARLEATNVIKQILLPDGTDMASVAPKRAPYEAARRELKDIISGTASGKKPTLAVIPIWTKIHDHDLIALAVVDSTRNTVKTVVHRLLPKSRWDESVRSKTLNKFFADTIRELTQPLNLGSLPAAKEDMSLIIRNQAVSRRLNEIDRTALALMLSAPLTEKFTVVSPLATELMTTIHGFYGQKNSMRKANREVVARITYEKPPIKASLPTSLKMTLSGTDAVFGKTLPWSWSESMTISARPDNTMNIQFSDRLSRELETEQLALNRSELPQVAKIKGAWAYLDKGRAWGLQMNDRLVSSEDPSAIKGHVVSYFGPELNLKSSRGWPIHEGAIIYIRKGQKSVKLGQSFTYDGMKVPTAWPPASSTNKP